MVFGLILEIRNVVERVLLSCLSSLIYVIAFLALAYYLGWIERYIWWCLEKEASKALNKAKLTIGAFRIDWSEILQGKITLHASNVVLHTPQRNVWQWESPLIARVGTVSVVCNAPVTILHFVLFRQELPIEIFSVVGGDIQVFVERRDSVINVYLLDKGFILPSPPNFANAGEGVGGLDLGTVGAVSGTTTARTSMTLETDDDDDDDHKEQAQQLVNEMIHAVQSLGRAAQRGNLNTEIKQQGLELADKLRKGLTSTNVKANKPQLEQGVKVIQEVGKAAVESLQTPKLILPDRRDDLEGKPVYARIGRIAVKDIRIFTKDSWIQIQQTNGDSNGAAPNTTSNISPSRPDTGGSSNSNDDSYSNSNTQNQKKNAGWNKPIFIENFVVRASELCPPLSLTDSEGLPAIYQSVDKVAEVLWRRLLAEMAKSNTGKLFQAAIGEVLSVMKAPPTKESGNSGGSGSGSSHHRRRNGGTNKSNQPPTIPELHEVRV